MTRRKAAARHVSPATEPGGLEWDASWSDFIPDASEEDLSSGDDLEPCEELLGDGIGQADTDSVVAIDGDTLRGQRGH